MIIHELKKRNGTTVTFPSFDNIFLKMPENFTPFIACEIKFQ